MFHDMRSVQFEMALLTSSRASQTHGHPEGRAARLFTLILEGPRAFTSARAEIGRFGAVRRISAPERRTPRSAFDFAAHDVNKAI
jgi:hypothetical protein